MPYVDKVKSVKNTGVSQTRWAIWREIWKWSCLPSLLYCISRNTVDTEYTYYSWCMTSTDIVKWRKTKDYENFEKRGVLEKRGEEETKSMPHACVQNNEIEKFVWLRMKIINRKFAVFRISSVYPCVVCESPVRTRQEALRCDSCDRWQHLTCNPGKSKIYIFSSKLF